MAKPGEITAMISSTAADLPEHRKEAFEACLRASVFPIGMEHLPARDATGIQASLEMVDQGDIYIGIYAWRYGWVPDGSGVPNPNNISITEMEFDRALERRQRGELKDILIFVMHEDHPIRARDKEDGAEAQEKLRKFKDRASTDRVRLTFSSPEELRGLVVQSLSESLRRIELAEASAKPSEPAKLDLHPPTLIPIAPQPYIAHPYSLLQTAQVVGRQAELNLLTDWVTTNQQVPANVRLFNVVAIGGMGKSALTWKWFNDIAPHELPNRAGWMWWSFYESDAHYENFIIRALAYASGQSEQSARELKPPEREDQLWRLLDERPFVLVLDGLERILLAYARMDAARMLDDDLDERTANRIANARVRLEFGRIEPGADEQARGPHSRQPAQELARALVGDDALNLWREFKVSGSRDQLLPLFRSFGNYPLLVRALRALLIEAPRPLGPPGEGRRNGKGSRPCADNRALDTMLTELEDRGLMGWDKQANRYDLHPIVRGVVWAALAPEAKQGLYHDLHSYFDAAPRPPQWEKVESLEDLTSAVELFDKLIGLERYQDACDIFYEHLSHATLYRLSASRLRVELLERLFPDGVDAPARLEKVSDQSYTLNALAAAYHLSGEPGWATPLFRRAAEIHEREKDKGGLAVDLCNLALTLWPSGQLREAESASRRALGICREQEDRFQEGVSLFIGATLAARGETTQSQVALRRSLAIFVAEARQQFEGVTTTYLAQRHLWLGQPRESLPLTQRAWDLANVLRIEVDFILAARLHGEAALGIGDLDTAEERLHHALTRARAVNFVEEELPALTALAELHRQRRQYGPARELLEQVWAPAERGPYPLWHADARNVLARIERDEGQRDAAIAAATRAYELAWCDGPPYAYHFGLTNAKQLLAELGAPEPKLPPFDASKFEPMLDVDLNPKDELWVDPDSLTP